MTRKDYGIALGMAGLVILGAWALPSALGTADPLPASAPAPVSAPTEDAAFPVPSDWPAWMAEAEDDWWAGQDTHRLAEIHSAVEYATQEGLTWERVTQEVGDALAEGETPPGWEGKGEQYPWEDCVIAYGPTTVVVCEDGTVVTS